MKEKSASPAAKRQARIRRILVPVDFSEHSKDALRYAVDLGLVFDAEIVLVFVVEIGGVSRGPRVRPGGDPRHRARSLRTG